MRSILGAYKYLSVILGGIGTVMIARWYWWRVNAASEITALIVSFLVGNTVELTLPSTEEADLFGVRVLITVTAVSVAWVVGTLLTSTTPGRQTMAFYARVKIAGPGWKKVRQLSGIAPTGMSLKESFIGWMLSLVFLFSSLLGLGQLLLGAWVVASFYLAVAVSSGFGLRTYLGKMQVTD